MVAAVVSPVLLRARRSVALRALDLADVVRGRRDPLVPPRRLDGVGTSDFAATGDEFLGYFVGLGGLRPDERVLDMGCGIGRMARPLAGFLGPEGRYDGFDASPGPIAWCRRRYADRPSFAFAHLDVHNARYHPAGRIPARAATFPYDDATFDFAFATSLFTHLPPDDAERYLAEAARVLRPGGRLYVAEMTARFVDSPALRAVSLHPRDGDRPTPGGIAAAASACGLQVVGSTTRYRGWWTALVAQKG